MSLISMPSVVQTPSINYTPSLISHTNFFVHMTEGGDEGSVAWLCQKIAKSSAHMVMSMNGKKVWQLVPLQFKAWAQCDFNSRGISLEIPGFTSIGIPDERWRAAALIIAWCCRAYNIPIIWAKGGQGPGICQHVDLGAAGGGHHDACPLGGAVWLSLMRYIKESYDLLGNDIPMFALHGLPNPHVTQLPPAVVPEPSHGGTPRDDGDDHNHDTPSGYPAGSIGDWQWRLRKSGANPQLEVDDNEGAATRRAIGVFQHAYGLPKTSEVNPTTWAALVRATS